MDDGKNLTIKFWDFFLYFNVKQTWNNINQKNQVNKDIQLKNGEVSSLVPKRIAEQRRNSTFKK